MSVARRIVPSLAILAVLTSVACQDTADPTSPVEPQYAKGGGKGGGTPPSTAPELREYYVFQDEFGTNQVHIVATGTFPMVNLNVVQDYIFNGIRDDNYSIYYEFTTMAPAPIPIEDVGSFDAGAGAWHIDIPWHGEGNYWDNTDANNPVRGLISFPDFPHADLDGSGADPYAFDIRLQKENGDYIAGWQPQGVILGGSVGGPVADATGYHEGEVHSYATFLSSRPDAVPVYIADMGLDESSLTCRVQTIREGRGKSSTTRRVTQVSVTGRVVLSDGSGTVPEGWLDVLLARSTNDPDQPEYLDTFTRTSGAEAWAEGYLLTTEFDGALSDITLQFAVPYVYATDLLRGTVYAPALNANVQGQGWHTLNAGPISTLGVWPVALTDPMTVTCGG